MNIINGRVAQGGKHDHCLGKEARQNSLGSWDGTSYDSKHGRRHHFEEVICT